MTAPSLSLDMSEDGLSLFARDEDSWMLLGRAQVIGSQVNDQMAVLRRIAASHLEGSDRGRALDVLLVVPADQALWKHHRIRDLSPDPAMVNRLVTDTLEGQTPLALADLRFDWRRGDTDAAGVTALDVAILATETMQEAERFATSHGFRPVAVIAHNPESSFPDTAQFGLSDLPQAATGLTMFAAPTPETILSLPEASVPEPVPVDPTLSPAQRAAQVMPIDSDSRRPAPEQRPKRQIAKGPMLVALSGTLAAALVGAAIVLPQEDTPVSLPQAMIAPQELSPPDPDTLIVAPEAVSVPTLETRAQEGISPPTSVDSALSDMETDSGFSGPGIRFASEPPQPVPEALVQAMGALSVHLTPQPQGIQTRTVAADPAFARPGVDLFEITDALTLTIPSDGELLRAPIPPGQVPEQGVLFDVGEDGFVRPSPDGTAAPGGYLVAKGAPPVQASPRPEADPEAEGEIHLGGPDDPGYGLRPRARPATLLERWERARYGGLTLAELKALRPVARDNAAGARAAAVFEANRPVVRIADASTVRPKPRPTAKIQAAQAKAALAAAAAAAKQSAAAAAPTPAVVSRQATDGQGLNLSRINLLGTFGKPEAMRAMVRLPRGRILSLSPGDRLDGGRVVSITPGELRYVKGGKTIALAMPKG